MRFNKKSPLKSDKKAPPKTPKKGIVGYNKKTALLEEAITQMNEGKYGRSSAALKELLALDPLNTEARRLFATLHLRLGSLISARTAFESLAREALDRQDFWLAESLLREYLAAGPRCVPFLDMLGQVYEQKGDSMAAVAEYGKAIEVLAEDPDPDHPDRALDLFAKIRSLAADSPEAMRLAPLFDSASGRLLSPPPVSNPGPSSEDLQPAIALDSAADGSPPIPTEPSQSYTDPAPGPEAMATSEAPAAPEGPIGLVDPPQEYAPQTTLESTPAEATGDQEPTIGEGASEKTHVNADRQMNGPPAPLLPVSDRINETPDTPCKAGDEGGTTPAPAIASQIDPAPIPTPGTTELSTEKDSEPASQVIVASITVPDFSLREVTHPIAEAPSSPVSMPWDQVQDTTLSIPLPSVEPESLLSSMSWEQILAEVGNGAEQSSPILEQPALDSKEPVLTPISEPVAEAQPLPVPMPWEQVEEESVPILRHEPEPEFGLVSEQPLPPVKDEAEALPFEGLESNPHDVTLAIKDLTAAPPTEQGQVPTISSGATPHKPVQEQSSEPQAEPALEQSYTLPPVEEDSPVLTIPSEPTSVPPIETSVEETAPVQSITEETPLPDISGLADETAIVADTIIDVAALPVTRIDTEAASSEPARAERAASDTSLPIAHPDFPSVSFEPCTVTPAPPEPIPALEASLSIGQPVEQEPQPAGREAAPSEEINILWDGRSPHPITEQAETGLLSRWLRSSKQHEPAASLESSEPAVSESNHEPRPATSPVALEPKEYLTAEAPIPVIATSDLSRDQTIRASSTDCKDRLHKAKPRKPSVASLSNRIATRAGRFIGGCFSTTRSIIISVIALVSAIVVSGLAAIGLAALMWVFMEESPSPAFHNLNVTPQRTLQEASTNGYLALLGFDRGAKQDAAQAGFARKFDKSDLALTAACLMSFGDRRGGGRTETATMLAGWYHDPDPATRFKAQATNLRSWMNEANRSMARYRQWLTMPFEDWGYGELMSPNCPVILHAHRLYVAEGFAQDLEAGTERLVTDVSMWRNVMTQAKSLSIKMLAASAVNDDTAVMSGLLGRPDLDEMLVARLAKAVRPLNQGEQSLRWPMQSELKAAEKMQDAILKSGSGESPIFVSLVSMMPLPTQKRLNSYAEYYEASQKAATESGSAGLPKRAGFVRYPAESWLDYALNPVENIAGVPPLPEWETYGGRLRELDAKLRLASLQAWIKRSPQEQDIPTRMAKAGQALYDPFTGFPMLVNRRKGLIYSVGPDGKDHDGQPAFDIAAVIPPQPGGFPSDAKRSTNPIKTRP